MASTDRFVYMAHHFILLRVKPFSLRVDRDGWLFEHSVPQFRVLLSAEGAKNVSWSWLSLLRECVSLTMTSTSKFVYMAHHFILLRLNPFSLRVDRLGWMYQHSLSELRVCLSAEGAKIFFWHWLSLLRGWGSLPMAPTCYGSIPLVLGLISRDSGLNTVSHRCEFACQQKVPKTFPGPGYLRSNDVVV